MSSMTYPSKGEEPMTRFKIDRENNITAFGSSEHIEDSGGETEIFASRQELAALAEKWPATRLVEIWNSLPGIEPVERFTTQQARRGPLFRQGGQFLPAGKDFRFAS